MKKVIVLLEITLARFGASFALLMMFGLQSHKAPKKKEQCIVTLNNACFYKEHVTNREWEENPCKCDQL